MNDFSPQRPYNQLALLNDCSTFNLPELTPLCHSVSQRLQRVSHIYQTLSCARSACELLPLQEAMHNTCPIGTNLRYPQLLRAYCLLPAQNDLPVHMSLRFHQALRQASTALPQRPLCTATALLAARVIAGKELNLRQSYSPIVLHGARAQIAYQPPVGEELLRSRLANWERFLHERIDIHPLLRMAIGHWQFLSISPFPQANRRSAHILCQLYLLDKGLLLAPVVALSSYFLRYQRNYEDLFLNVHYRGQWREWLEFILNATAQQADETELRLTRLQQLWDSNLKQLRQHFRPALSEVLCHFIMQYAYCRPQHIVDAGIAQSRTAKEYLQVLSSLGILHEQGKGREMYYRHTRLAYFLEHGELPSIHELVH